MLGKLFRHEWKATWKFPLTFICIMLSMTVVAVLSCSSLPGLMDAPQSRSDAYELLTVTTVLGFIILWIAAMGAATFGIMLYFAIRFYRNLYTDEGYLMHTLPVTSTQLIWSKFLVMFLWELLTALGVIVSVFTFILGIACMESGMSPWRLFEEASRFFPDFFSSFRETFRLSFFTYLFWSLLTVLVMELETILCIYAAISVGQCAKSHKVAASVGCYLGFSIVGKLLYQLLLFGFNLHWHGGFYSPGNLPFLAMTESAAGTIILKVYLPNILLSLILAAAYYLLTEWMMRKHLNLE